MTGKKMAAFAEVHAPRAPSCTLKRRAYATPSSHSQQVPARQEFDSRHTPDINSNNYRGPQGVGIKPFHSILQTLLSEQLT